MKSKVVSKLEDIFSYNIDTIPNLDVLIGDSRVNVPFPCDCINDEFLGHTFLYELHQGDTYASIAEFTFSNLTT
ncbi:receptor-like protein kinase, partial [Trifolium medium]|nr:receptor-like protein kinase [Trifolium medium]